MRFSVKTAALSLMAALLLTSCSSNSITGVTLTLPDTMEKGVTGTAVPDYTYSGATPEQEEAEELAAELGLSYSSSDPSVVMVDADGNLVAVSAGTAEITLASEDGELSASGVITVVVSPTGLVMPESLTLTEGGEAQSAAATVQPEDATEKTITYTSSDESVATVDAAGNITPISAGEAVITSRLGELEASCIVTVEKEKPAEPEETPADGQEESSQEPDNGQEPQTASEPDSSDHSGSTNSANSTGSADSTSSTSSGNSAASASSTEPPAPTDDTAYGEIPFSSASGSGIWWFIDSSDSAYSAVLENINAYREAAGVAPLTVDSELSAIAKERCDQMVDTGLTHDGAQTVEIIGQNASSAQAIVDAWANSADHYAAMVSASFTSCGIGCFFNEYGWTYWCVTFR